MSKAVLLINLGSPDSTAVSDVKRYLDEFLMDKHVIDYPYLFRALLVKGIILRTRPPRSAEAYSKIWTDKGSPLIVHTEALRQKVDAKQDIPVYMAMRYGSPSIQKQMHALYERGVRELFVVPLYPQYAMSTTETVEKEVEKSCKILPGLRVDYNPPFYGEKNYLGVLASSIESQIEGVEYDHVLFSFHGLPERHIYKTDSTNTCRIDGNCCWEKGLASHKHCYRHQCYSVVDSMVEKLGLDRDKVSAAFQSRLGRDKWLDPSTDGKVEELLANGVKKLVVISPAFVADCLETLEELNMELRHEFMSKGGEEFTFVECLNSSEGWVNVVSDWISNWK